MFVHSLEDDPNWSGWGEIEWSPTGPAKGGNDFIVSLGALNDGVGSPDHQAGTFMHELGHNLGLEHGGNDQEKCKPNYLSVMSYLRQFSELVPERELDYSDGSFPSINENANINESTGIGNSGSPQRTVYGGWDSSASHERTLQLGSANSSPLDFDRDGNPSGTVIPPQTNIHWIDMSDCRDTSTMDLVDFDDWTNLVFDLKDSALFADGVHIDYANSPPELDEVSYQGIKEMRVGKIDAIHETIDGAYP